MDIQEMFSILGLDETTDADLIRAAYLKKLNTVNPEDNPEGFKRLRRAYEEALLYGKRQVKIKEEPSDNPVGIFLHKAEEIYRSISRRIDKAEWEKLLKDDILDDLDLGEETKWRLFAMLADKFRLPSDIWRILDRVFGIVQNEQSFKEHLNVNFVDFMIRNIVSDTEEGHFTYDRFEGRDQADYDTFLDAYYKLRRLLDVREPEDRAEWEKEISRQEAFLDSLDISHPRYVMEKARICMNRGEKAEAEEKAREVLAQENGPDKDPYVLLGGARILLPCGYSDEAEKLLRELLEQENLDNNLIYMASWNMAEICFGRNDLAEARTYVRAARQCYNTREAVELENEISRAVVALYTGERKDSLTEDDGLLLAKVFIQLNQEEQGAAFFAEHPLLEQDTAACHMLKGLMSLGCGEAERALNEAEAYRKCLLAEGNDVVPETEEDEKNEKKTQELAQSWRMEAQALQQLYLKSRDGGSEEALLKDRAMSALDTAISLCPDEVSLLAVKVVFLNDIGDYEQMVEVCRQIIKLAPSDFYAYYYLQDACVKLDRAQEVVDAFYAARRIYDKMPRIYEHAVTIFIRYRQYRDASHVLELAGESGVASQTLSLQKLKVMRLTVTDEESFRQADCYAEELIAEFGNAMGQSGTEAEDETAGNLAEAYLQRCYLYDSPKAGHIDWKERLDKMEQWAKEALDISDNVNMRYFLGRLYCQYREDTKKALEQLKICEERGMTFPWLFHYIGACYREEKKLNDAIAYEKRALEGYPEEEEFIYTLSWRYREKFVNTAQKEYADESFRYIETLRNKFGDSGREYWQLAVLYLRCGEKEKALECSELSLKERENALRWEQKGKILDMLDRGDEAFECYQKSIEIARSSGTDRKYSFTQSYWHFVYKGDYEGGVKWFRDQQPQILTEEQRRDNLDSIKNLYESAHQWDEALGVIAELYGGTELSDYVCDSWELEGERIMNLLDLYESTLSDEELLDKAKQACDLLEGTGSKAPEDNPGGKLSAYRELGYIYANNLLDDKTALIYFEKAMEQLKLQGKDADTDDWQGLLISMMRCHWQLGESERAKAYGELYMQKLAERYEECRELGKSVEELHGSACGCMRNHLSDLIQLNIFCGNLEEARRLEDILEQSEWCWWCPRKVCTEEWDCRGYLALADEDWERARECFERALDSTPNGYGGARRELKRIKLNFT